MRKQTFSYECAVLTVCSSPLGRRNFFFLRFTTKKVCTACSGTNKTVRPTNLNKYLYNDKSEIKLNINNSSGKSVTEYVSVITFVFLVHGGQVGYSVITHLLRWEGQ